MYTLTINEKTVGECSRPRERGYGNFAYVFLMKDNYYITIEKNDILDCQVVKKNDNDYEYEYTIRKMWWMSYWQERTYKVK